MNGELEERLERAAPPAKSELDVVALRLLVWRRRRARTGVVAGVVLLASTLVAVGAIARLGNGGIDPVVVTSPTGTGETAELTSGTWELTGGTVHGATVELSGDIRPLTLTIADATAVGRSACNEYLSPIVTAEDTLRLVSMTVTEGACHGRHGDAERLFLEGLETATGFEITDDRLALHGPGVELIYARYPTFPLDRAVGKLWSATAVLRSRDWTAIEGSETITFELTTDGELRETIGCISRRGTFEVRGGEFNRPDGRSARGSCGPEDVSADARHVNDVLQRLYRVEVEGDTMTVRSWDGLGALFRETQQ